MKMHVILFLGLFFLASFQNNDIAEKSLKNNSTVENPKLVGTWELISRYNYKNNKVVDTFLITESYKQIKMYSATKVMWSRTRPADSTELFGYGSYKINDKGNRLTEILDYGSAVMNQIIEEKKEFVFELDLKENSFTQIELDEDGNRVISENYIRIE